MADQKIEYPFCTNMNNPIQIMYAEHEVILQAAEVIKKIDNQWTIDPETYQKTVVQLLTFFREYADGYHHHKEEIVLFPAVYDHPDFTLQAIIDEFNQHHEDFREYSAEISEALATGDYPRSYKILRQYINELRDHIAAENDELFVLAENLLDPNELETIYFKFQDVDMELGEKRKAELAQILQSLL